jgi:hypothetical protein
MYVLHDDAYRHGVYSHRALFGYHDKLLVATATRMPLSKHTQPVGQVYLQLLLMNEIQEIPELRFLELVPESMSLKWRMPICV